MASLRDELAADLGKGISIYDQSFEWNGADYPCVRNPAPAGLAFEDGGYVQKIAETILVARTAFTGTLPAIGDGVDNDTAQIKDIDPNTENLILHIGSFDQGE